MLRSAAHRDRLDLEQVRLFHEHHDLRARDELVARMMPLIRTLAGRFVGRGETFDDLVQVGALGLVLAIGRFEPAPGVRFAAYATPTIVGEMRRHFRDHCWDVHVPRAAQELAARVPPARDALSERHGRPPTATEIAERLDEPVERVRDAVAASRGYRVQSFDAPTADGTPGVLERHGSTDPGFARVVDRDVVDRAYAVLDGRSAGMVRGSFAQGRLQREIADEHGVSQMQVSRVIGASLTRMGRDLDADTMLAP